MNTMKKIVAFAMIVSMVLGCLIISTSAAEKKEYVKDGLVAWYDATNNSNGTHDVKSDLWKDLSGNANHIDISDAVSNGQIDWEAGALVIKDGGCYLRIPTKVVSALEGRAYTIEIVTGNLEYTASSYITLLNSSNDELSVFIRVHEEFAPAPGNEKQYKLEYKNQDANGDSNRPFVYNAWDHFNGKTLTVTSDLDALDENGRDNNETVTETDNVIMYSDATRIGSGESEYAMDLGGYVYFGNTAENREWHGQIYGLRFYNRALSAEEVKQNAEADQWNYRSNQTFEPKEEYDPELDKNYEGFVKLEGYTNDKVVFNKDTDLIPLTGFYGSVGLLDYLYPFESDDPWEGARLMKNEEVETDYDGSVVTGCSFDIMYQSFCTRAGITAIEGKKVQYIAIKLMAKGAFEDFTLKVVGYDSATQSEPEFSTSSEYGGIDPELDGQTQYLIYDVEGIFDDASYITKMQCDVTGMDEETEIYVYEICFFETYNDARAYAGLEPVDEETTAEDKDEETTVAEDEETTEKKEEVTTEKKEESTTAAPKDDDKGCASVVGFGAAAVLVAAAAAVVLKKKD